MKIVSLLHLIMRINIQIIDFLEVIVSIIHLDLSMELKVKTKFLNKDLNFKIGQAYEINKNSNYSQTINQTSHFSDLAIEAGSYENINFKVNSRLDKNNFSKKEMNYL